MERMLLFFRVIVFPCLVKGFGTVAVFVDVQAEEAGGIWEVFVRQVEYLNLYIDAAGRAWIKECKPPQVRIFIISLKVRKGSRAHKWESPAAGFRLLVHKNPLLFLGYDRGGKGCFLWSVIR